MCRDAIIGLARTSYIQAWKKDSKDEKLEKKGGFDMGQLKAERFVKVSGLFLSDIHRDNNNCFTNAYPQHQCRSRLPELSISPDRGKLYISARLCSVVSAAVAAI